MNAITASAATNTLTGKATRGFRGRRRAGSRSTCCGRSPSVKMDFHDSPANHHAAVVKQYPKNWRRPAAKQGRKKIRRTTIAASKGTITEDNRRIISHIQRNIMLGTILLVLLVLMLLGALPAWPHSRNWGYYPSGGVGCFWWFCSSCFCWAGFEDAERMAEEDGSKPVKPFGWRPAQTK